MKKIIPSVVVGVAITPAVGWTIMPKQMIKERKSPLGYEETIAKVEQNVKQGGWVISSTIRLDKSLAKHQKEVLPVALINICQPEYAAHQAIEPAKEGNLHYLFQTGP